MANESSTYKIRFSLKLKPCLRHKKGTEFFLEHNLVEHHTKSFYESV